MRRLRQGMPVQGDSNGKGRRADFTERRMQAGGSLMAKDIIDTGNNIIAEAVRLAKPAVVSAYPITPQTTVVEKLANMIETKKMKSEFICVESEHSAMTACIGASATGVRTYTATSSHGLLLMHEMLHWASMARLPVVMTNINRAIGPGWNIWCDLNDAMAQRDTGWIQIYCAYPQELFDTTIQAFKLAEDKRIALPVMVNHEGFIMSHTSMPARIYDETEIDKYLPKYNPIWKLDVSDPLSHGNILDPDHYMEIRRDIQKAQEAAKELIVKNADDWRRQFGSYFGGLIDYYKCDDADLIMVTMGTIGAEGKIAIDALRKEGKKVGLARIRSYRPFPEEEIRKLSEKAALLVIDRAISLGIGGGILYNEINGCACDGAKVYGIVAGLGGRDVTYGDVEKMLRKVIDGKAKPVEWYGLKGVQ
ncbi:MAG: pyruvate ferredoxin oxidoreductase [Thermoplasmata archaeon HGW-Thermoplasmata-2]|nr:MAG: pyruvate ferredoxin oxidoreductase [Thermoplasmata archaeon HGW-Thermoplasmata-2]